jgi:hypothetical protein
MKPVPKNGRGRPMLVPGSAGAQRPGGALVLEAPARPYTLDQPDGTKRHLMALTVIVVNRRNNTRRRFIDVTFAFQVRLEAPGLYPRANVTGYASSDLDAALADLHYRDVAGYAVGCNTSAGWAPEDDGVVRAAHTDFLPAAEVARMASRGSSRLRWRPTSLRTSALPSAVLRLLRRRNGFRQWSSSARAFSCNSHQKPWLIGCPSPMF